MGAENDQIHVAFGQSDLKHVYKAKQAGLYDETQLKIAIVGFMDGLVNPGYTDALIEQLRKHIIGHKSKRYIKQGSKLVREQNCMFVFEGGRLGCSVDDHQCTTWKLGSAAHTFRRVLAAFPKSKFMISTCNTSKERDLMSEEEYLSSYANTIAAICSDANKCDPRRGFVFYDKDLKCYARTATELQRCTVDAKIKSHTDPDKAIFHAVYDTHAYNDGNLEEATRTQCMINAVEPTIVFFVGGGYPSEFVQSFNLAYPVHTHSGKKATLHMFQVQWSEKSAPQQSAAGVERRRGLPKEITSDIKQTRFMKNGYKYNQIDPGFDLSGPGGEVKSPTIKEYLGIPDPKSDVYH